MTFSNSRGEDDLPLVGLNSLVDLTTLKESRSEEAVKMGVVGIQCKRFLEFLHSLFVLAYFIVVETHVYIKAGLLLPIQRGREPKRSEQYKPKNGEAILCSCIHFAPHQQKRNFRCFQVIAVYYTF
jgi:hypothetical protein